MAEQRCAVVAVLGAPNAGKSTLVNTLVGAKVAAVTQKVQTTRALVRGIAMEGHTQLILIDTPGVFAPKRRLPKAASSFPLWPGRSDVTWWSASVAAPTPGLRRQVNGSTRHRLSPFERVPTQTRPAGPAASAVT